MERQTKGEEQAEKGRERKGQAEKGKQSKQRQEKAKENEKARSKKGVIGRGALWHKLPPNPLSTLTLTPRTFT